MTARIGAVPLSRLEAPLNDVSDQLQAMALELKIPSAFICVHSHGATLIRKFGTGQSASAGAYAPFTRVPPHPPHEAKPASHDETIPSGPAVDGDKDIFGVGSLSKILIAVLYIRLIEVGDEQKVHKDLEWDTKIYKFLNSLRERSGKSTIPALERDMTVEEALLQEGFPRLQSFLLGYGGRPLTTTEDFLRYAADIANHMPKKKNPPASPYSNCNMVLLVALVVELYNERFATIIHREVLQPLSMTKTSFRKEELVNWDRDGLVQSGHRISADLQRVSAVEPFKYLDDDDDLSSAVFGCHSCVGDFAKLLTAINQALDEERGSGFLTSRMANCLLSYSDKGRCRTFFGLRDSLQSDLPGSDSLDLFLRKSGQGPSYRLNKANLKGKNVDIMVQYKGGLIDGFTSSIYFVRGHQTFVIVMCNGLGILDYADRACHVVMQRLLNLQPMIDLYGCLKADISIVQQHLKPIEDRDRDIPELTPEINAWVGTYQHTHSNHRIKISETGYFTKSGSVGLEDRVMCRIINNSLQIYPDRELLVIDMRSDFKDTQFTMKVGMNSVLYLVSNLGEAYKKISEEY